MATNVSFPPAASLKKYDDLSTIEKDRKYYIANPKTALLDPITPEELELKAKDKKFCQEAMVYADCGRAESDKMSQGTSRSRRASRYKLSRTVREVKSIPKPKYNLFSIFDEGINNLLRGGSWTFPSNEIIAPRRNRQHWVLSDNKWQL